ncbi:MAG: matrixin family metalloprotease [Pseudomonadota bacterium]
MVPGEAGDDVRAVQALLGRAGYLGSNYVPGVMCSSTCGAVRDFQRSYRLAETGVGDEATLALMQRPRCGVPDVDRARGLALAPFSAVGCAYPNADLTYAILNATPDLDSARQREILAEAFDAWARVSALRFREVAPEQNPTFTIAWQRGDHGDGAPFDDAGSMASNTLAHAFFPPPCGGPNAGSLHFDEFELWTDESASNRIRLLNVAIHEIGHLLGLGHSDNRDAIMFAFYADDVDRLRDDDVAGVQHLYGPPARTAGDAAVTPFRFRPTADSDEFDAFPEVADAWHRLIDFFFESNIHGAPDDEAEAAVEELRRWGRGARDLRFYNPVERAVPTGSTPANVTWSALPTSFEPLFHGNEEGMFAFLDEPQFDSRIGRRTRVQDEYAEWTAMRDNEGRIRRIVFTSEPPEFYRFLFEDRLGVGTDKTHPLLLSLYRERCDGADVRIDELADPLRPDRYDPYNDWNNRFCVHMQQSNNTLGAQINIAARSAILREDTATGAPITSAQALIACARYGAAERQSDPTIGAVVNAQARENRFLTLENPVGLYMTGIDLAGFATPDGSDVGRLWSVKKGRVVPNRPDRTMIVRAEFAAPEGVGFGVSDVTIGGAPIRFGAEVARHVGIRLGVLLGPVSDVPPPRPIGCVGQAPRAPGPLALLARRGG